LRSKVRGIRRIVANWREKSSSYLLDISFPRRFIETPCVYRRGNKYSYTSSLVLADDGDEQDAKRVTDRARATKTIIASGLTTDFRLARYRENAHGKGGGRGTG